MQINLNKQLLIHFERLQKLADRAATDNDESLSARASAMSALSALLRDLTKVQSEIINLQRLQRIEALTIATLKKFLTPEQHEQFLEHLEEALSNDE